MFIQSTHKVEFVLFWKWRTMLKKKRRNGLWAHLYALKKQTFFYGIRSLCDWMKETRDVDPGSGRQDMTKVSGLCCRKLFLFFSHLNPKSRSARRAGIQIVNYFVYYVQIGGYCTLYNYSSTSLLFEASSTFSSNFRLTA